jgi:hypothetical protein
MVKLSIWDDSRREIECHKWIESQRVGYDMGEIAIRGWIHKHWRDYLRAKWLEHLQGKAFWIELDRDDFGLLQQKFQDQPLLLDRIVDRLKSGQENLHVILWAIDFNLPTEDVLAILVALDINSRRIAYKFGE